MKVAIIGGGAAGFFASISCKSQFKNAQVTIYEKSHKLLSKVKVSGGGRCNVTNACESNAEFLKNYPRGQQQLKKTFNHFNRKDTILWFQTKGVELKAEADGRMFPVTNDSQTIIDCLKKESLKAGVTILPKCGIEKIHINDEVFDLVIKDGIKRQVDYVVVATGGSPKKQGYHWLEGLGHSIIDPVPSLFTFNISEETKLKAMMGLTVPNANVKIQGTKLDQCGPVLITHWGLSGLAVIKLSALGARLFNELHYDFTVLVNWLGLSTEGFVRTKMEEGTSLNKKKKLANANFFDIPNRLWLYLLDRISLDDQLIWGDVKKKDRNRLINVLFNDAYAVKGKTTFKEEFVTCGGIDKAEIDFNTMQSRVVPNLFFAGEVLDIDGVTGGFNFQAAWSTGFIAGKLAK